ncbi:MAG: phosphoribosylformylglycinamidine synthase [Parcubacteria group bacterium]
MEKLVKHYYRKKSEVSEVCFNVEILKPLSKTEENILRWLLSETFDKKGFSEKSFLENAPAEKHEVGPRLNFATPWNTNALSILRSCGLNKKVGRIEVSRRSLGSTLEFDRMTEMFYEEPIKTFSTGQKPEEVYEVPLMEKGLSAFAEIDGLSMDEYDKKLYYDYFVNREKRNPTIVEIMDLNNANSEHCRHGYFKGQQIINGQEMKETLMDVVKSTWSANPENSVIAFNDNSSGIKGFDINTIMPASPGNFSNFRRRKVKYHFIFTAETHNFPTGVAPFPGAQTGTGGRIRDIQATGRGGLMLAGTVGYAVGDLFLTNYDLPWEKKSVYPPTLASAKDILIAGSNGTTRYGNEIGEPVISGFVRTGASRLPNGERREFLKPILFSGGIGQIDSRHLDKIDAKKGMLIVEIGGPAYRIGFGGGAASSLMQGENKEQVDFDAVQRGDAEMEQKMNRVVRACVELGDKNPIASIHDQGAGGPANVLKELVEKTGGTIDIRRINLGDPTLSVLEIWVAEYQERNGLLIFKDSLKELEEICEREKVPLEVLGVASDDGIFRVYDSEKDEMPVELDLKALLSGMPQKTFVSNEERINFSTLHLPKKETIYSMLRRVMRLSSVGSKRFLTNKGDRSVTGLIAQQQCCGWPQVTVSDVAVVAQSHFVNDKGLYSGAATSIGEQPIKMLVNPEAGARMAVAEAVTNMAGALISGLDYVKCSANWMGAPKLPGEGVNFYKAATAMRDLMIEIGMAIDGGKDSLSMATKVEHPDGRTELVKSPLELVISAYAPMPDITKVVTPDFKLGTHRLLRIDLAVGKRRLGGSALAQVYNQLGNETPDIDDPQLLLRGFKVVQELVSDGMINACHDISDGGMISALMEMAFAGNSGFDCHVRTDRNTVIEELFAEEAGWIIAFDCKKEENILELLEANKIPFDIIGITTPIPIIRLSRYVRDKKELLLADSMANFRSIWEETSFELDRLQCDERCVNQERINSHIRNYTPYKLSFEIDSPKYNIGDKVVDEPKVAIVREEGSNGDREMSSYFKMVGFDVYDVTMTDVISGKADLQEFRGVAFVGGFSYADVLDSAKGWAATILFNKKVKKMFDDFYNRPDTFSLGVCNGCQLSALLGWVPKKAFKDEKKIRFIENDSKRFESRFSTVKISSSPAIMLKEMADSVLGIWSAHGEGKFHANHEVLSYINRFDLAPIRYVDDDGKITEQYPFNPNGSYKGIAAVCDLSGRHLAMMPHPERTFLKWQWAYMPENWKQNLKASPWLKMVQNAYDWCKEK